jgi:hypothetical protein
MSLLNVYSLSQTALGIKTIVPHFGNKHYNKKNVDKNNSILKAKSVMRIQNGIICINLFP